MSVLQISTANTNLDGTGSITELFIANGTYGSVLSSVRVQSLTALASDGMVRIFIKNGAAGTWRLLKEVPTPITSLLDPPYPTFATTLEANLSLMNDDRIGVSTNNANTFNISAFGYDITGFI